ncbi:MAG: hypothetical protein A4E58_00172 [Syntrophorhabdus sp. PtaB.Bin006]|nr:MAG: hypothetical protein A4E58_00172 [Syntrophorhabdus sp. PtaB.Bin006]
METGTVIPAVSNIFFGILIIVFSIPLMKNKIGMNHWYGIRFRESFESADNWYKINRYGAGRMVRYSIVIIAVSIMALFVPLPGGRILQLALACVPFLMVIPAIESWLYAKKLSFK